MATNGTTPTPARCTPDERSITERRDAYRTAVADPAFHAWSVAFLLREFFRRGVRADDISLDQAAMLEGVVRLLGRLTREVMDGAHGNATWDIATFTDADFTSTVAIPGNNAAAIGKLLGGFIDQHEDGEFAVDDIETLDGAVETLEGLTRQVWESAMAVEFRNGGVA